MYVGDIMYLMIVDTEMWDLGLLERYQILPISNLSADEVYNIIDTYLSDQAFVFECIEGIAYIRTV